MYYKSFLAIAVVLYFIAPTHITAQKESHTYAIILAGGKGERLWPLSREDKPKQFLEFSDNKTLLELTADRAKMIVPEDHIWVITHARYKANIRKLLGNHIGGIICEPARKNTGPALLLACLKLLEHDPDASIIFLSADHTIKEEALFCQGLLKATAFAQEHNSIALVGLRPTFPATGYGYIEYDWSPDKRDLYKIVRFHEKPPLEQAQDYITAGNMLWNAGYFCGKAITFVELFQRHAPLLYDQVYNYLTGTHSYEDVTNISFDHAVMEHANNTYVLPLQITWSDIGNLKIFLSKLGLDQHQNTVFTVDAHNNLICNSNKITALLAVDNLCIVNTGDVLLVAKQDDVERVKEVLLKLRATGNTACV